jgi:hypothetical protein
MVHQPRDRTAQQVTYRILLPNGVRAECDTADELRVVRDVLMLIEEFFTDLNEGPVKAPFWEGAAHESSQAKECEHTSTSKVAKDAQEIEGMAHTPLSNGVSGLEDARSVTERWQRGEWSKTRHGRKISLDDRVLSHLAIRREPDGTLSDVSICARCGGVTSVKPHGYNFPPGELEGCPFEACCFIQFPKHFPMSLREDHMKRCYEGGHPCACPEEESPSHAATNR